MILGIPDLTSPSIVAFDLDQVWGGLDGGLYCNLSLQVSADLKAVNQMPASVSSSRGRE